MHEERSAHTTWTGGIADGSGELTLKSGVGGTIGVTWRARAGAADSGETSPEELIAGAHASCYCMALSAELAKAGGTPQKLEVDCVVTFENVDGAPTITSSALRVVGTVAGLDEAGFVAAANAAKAGCPVSRALAGVASISLDARLA